MIVTGLDIETTGLDQAKGHRIIEVAAILYDLDTERELGRWVQRINPQRSIDPGAQAVHGISFEDVAASPVWSDVAPKLAKVMDRSDLIVAHNGEGFDLPFIGAEFLRIGIALPNVKCFDTMLEGRWATPMGKLPNLGELCFACGVDYDPAQAHAADYDVEVMMASFFRARRKGFFALPVTPAVKEAA